MAVRMTTSSGACAVSYGATRFELRVVEGHTGCLLLGPEEFVNLFADFAIRHLDIVLGIAILAHQREEIIVRDVELR